MITTIQSVDRGSLHHNFTVQEIPFKHKEFDGIEFQIRPIDGAVWKYFTFKILFVENRVLIYQLVNNDHPEVSGKGIVKAMIKAISDEYQMDIISSTNKDELKIDESEGRIPTVSEYWEQWRKADPSKIYYNQEEDRFIDKYIKK